MCSYSLDIHVNVKLDVVDTVPKVESPGAQLRAKRVGEMQCGGHDGNRGRGPGERYRSFWDKWMA
jgi:hypothetical protein